MKRLEFQDLPESIVTEVHANIKQLVERKNRDNPVVIFKQDEQVIEFLTDDKQFHGEVLHTVESTVRDEIHKNPDKHSITVQNAVTRVYEED